MPNDWFSLHTHSQYSKLDGMPAVSRMVAKAAWLKQPALGISDHGSMANVVDLYTESKKAGIIPFVGFEGYLLDPNVTLDEKNAERYHFCIYARDYIGYQALVKAMSLSHTRPRFNRFPRLTLDDLMVLGSDYGKHIVVTTGCFFGLPQQLLVNSGNKAAQGAVRMLASAFPHTFVEVQNHNIDHGGGIDDEHIVGELTYIADRLGLPVVATQDSHYVDQSEKTAHALMKRMVYGGKDDEFPGDSFHMASEEWVADHYDDYTWSKATEGSKHLLDLNELAIPALDKYKPRVPALHKDAEARLERNVKKGLRALGLANPKYLKRVAYEIGIINKLGMANYFLIVDKLCVWMKQQQICYEVRGSANGSLVLFALGVTTVDPIKWDLMFERFLYTDRVQPPDVDIDVEDAHRDSVVQKIQEWFPGAVRIGSWSDLGIREADQQGSIVVTYKSYLARMAKEAGREFKYGWLQNIEQVRSINSRDYRGLKQIDRMKSVYRSYGVHAAGVLLPGSDLPIEEVVPTMLIASSERTVSQLDQDRVEALGLVKLDVLGQVSLTVMKECQKMMGRSDPTDFTWIPDNDPAACKLLREGRTDTGIFHFEGYTKAKGSKEMGIKSTMDAILAIALYMPGAMTVAPGMTRSQTELYQERRANPELRSRVKYLHPVFEKALSYTYGTVIFQDQVIEIMRGLGMSMYGVNKFLKVLKDSGKGSDTRNAQRIAEVREEFDRVCNEAGLRPDDVWRQTASFVSYGFNKSHAAGYGLRAYRSAYLKAHHLHEYMAALLKCWSGVQPTKGQEAKEVLYAREARHMGIKILPPDVNSSDAVWTLDKSGREPTIRKGLTSIKGVGDKAAILIQMNRPYRTLSEMVERLPAQPVSGSKEFVKTGKMEDLNGVYRALWDANALNSIAWE